MNKKKLLKYIIVTLLAFSIYKISGKLISLLLFAPIPSMLLKETAECIIYLIAAFYAGKIDVLKFSFKEMKEGIITGWWFIVLPFITLYLKWSYYGIRITVSYLYIVLFLIFSLYIGINEELLFRGILLNGWIEASNEKSTLSIQKAIIYSGSIFGLIHITNVLNGVPLTSAIVQGICNVPAGILLGAIYIRCKRNLWPVILLHSFYDCLLFIARGVLHGADVTAAMTGYSIYTFIFAIIELLLALFIMRSSQLDHCI